MFSLSAAIGGGKHPFPYRTRKLSPLTAIFVLFYEREHMLLLALSTSFLIISKYTKFMDFDQIIKNRISCRSYSNKEVEEEKLQKILETIRSVPSAGNLQAFHVVVIKNKRIREELSQISRGKPFLSEAPICLVFLADKTRAEFKYGDRGRELYSVQDATIAASYCQLVATSLGLSTVWVGAFNPIDVSRIINVESKVPVAILPIGYPNGTQEIHEKRKLEDLVSYIE